MGASVLPVNAPDAHGTCGELAAQVKTAAARVETLSEEIAVARRRSRWNRIEKLGLEYLDLQPGDQAMLELVNQCRNRQRKQGKLLRLAVGLLLLVAVVAGYHVRNLRLEREFRRAQTSGKAEQALMLARRIAGHYVPAAKFLSDYEVALAGRARAEQMRQAVADHAGDAAGELLPKDAVAAMDVAEKAFAAGQYDDAAGAWETAVLSLVKARPVILGSETIARAEAEYAQALQKTDVPLVARWAAEPWKQAQTDALEARRLGRSLRWQESADLWRRAAAALGTAQEQAVAARNQATVAAALARGENLVKEQHYAAAVSALQAVMNVPGFAEDAKLKALLAKAQQGLENAFMRETVPSAEPAKRAPVSLLAAATRSADVPRDVVLTVKAKSIDGEKLPGAIVWINHVRQNEPAPFSFKLAGGCGHLIVIEPPATAKGFKTFATLWSPAGGADPELVGVLDRHVYSCWAVPGGGMKLKWIPPGEAQLGSTLEEQRWATGSDMAGRRTKSTNSFSEEGAEPRRVRVTGGFWLGQTEVTVGQWRRFVEATGYRSAAEKAGQAWCYDRVRKDWGYVTGKSWKDPGYALDVQENHPAVCLNGDDVDAFCNWLTEVEGKANRLPAGWAYRLPAEAEWEYACRGDKPASRFWWGDAWEDGKGRLNGASNDKLGFSAMGQSWKGAAAWSDGFAWAAPVDYYAARGRNGYDLADMLGNVGEWCADAYDPSGAHDALYRTAASGAKRVVRGGSFYCPAAELRTACRTRYNPMLPYADVGFRVCLGPAFPE
jgi:formylglycine-generating enzyme required for sulfatase activity